jgi:hypothetical protein
VQSNLVEVKGVVAVFSLLNAHSLVMIDVGTAFIRSAKAQP